MSKTEISGIAMSETSFLQKSRLPFSEGVGLTGATDRFGLKATILSGSYAGAQISFPSNRKDPIVAGSSPDNDIVLLSDNIASKHFIINVGSFINNKITILSEEGSVILKDGRVIDIGQRAEISLPAEISFGDASLIFEREIGVKQLKKLLKPGLIIAVCLLIGLVGSSIISNINPSNIISSVIPIANEQVESVNDISLLNIQKQNQTATLFEEQLVKMQLQEYLIVQKNSDNTISISGNLPEALMPQWRSVLQWYDGNSNLAYLVNNVTSKKVDGFKLAIKSVWLDGDNSIVTLSNNETAKVGDTITDGWLVQDILSDQIVLKRHNQIVKITY